MLMGKSLSRQVLGGNKLGAKADFSGMLACIARPQRKGGQGRNLKQVGESIQDAIYEDQRSGKGATEEMEWQKAEFFPMGSHPHKHSKLRINATNKCY